MKLFSKDKKKKPLTDKAKSEHKARIKHIVKIVLDILMYGFAILMAFALAVGGACSPKTKSASAYYHNDNGYTSINSVVVNNDSTTTLRYYYDFNFKKTFPDFSTIFDCFASQSIGSYYLAELGEVYTLDSLEYTHIGLYRFDTFEYHYRLISNRGASDITFVTLYRNDIGINRSDILTGLFNGVRVIKPVSNNYNWFRYLTYYFGELGYNRITYSFPINISRLAYLFVNSDNTDNLIENGYFFKNYTFPFEDNGQSTRMQSYTESIFLGSFRCNGVYYTSINFTFSSVYGTMLTEGQPYPVYFYLPGSNPSTSTTGIYSLDEFYKGYWYIDSITFTGNGVSTLVWKGFKEVPGGTAVGQNVAWSFIFQDLWFGDSAYGSSPYRDLYIYYATDSLSGVIHNPFNDNYPQLYGMTFADFINFIGEAYPTGNGGRPSDTTAPFTSVFEWLRIALSGVMPFFGYTLLPGITIGTLIMVPITMAIILFVVSLFKR